MNLEFNEQEFHLFGEQMKECGFIREDNAFFGQEKFYYYKPLITEDSGRKSCTLVFRVYDFSEFVNFEYRPFRIEPLINISRTHHERFDLNIIDADFKSIEHYILFAKQFYEFINDRL